MSIRVPKPRPGCDIRSLPLTPAQAFLLSRIDGTLADRDLAAMTGLPSSAVDEALQRLHDLGAIDLPGAAAPPPPPQARRPPSAPAVEAARAPAPPGPAERTAPRAEPRPSRPEALPPRPSRPEAPPRAEAPSPPRVEAGPAYDPAELAEEVEISPEKRRRILDLFYRLDQITHYELLGVAETADKKQIKAAYYALAPEFHPDSYFRKQLGSFKQRIEAIFTQVTLAHDVLTSKSRRPEYDEYLAQTRKNQTMAALIEQSPRELASITSAVDEPAQAIAAPEPLRAAPPAPPAPPTPPAPPPQRSPPAPAESPPPEKKSSSPAMPATPAISDKERREILARKLGGALRRPSSMSMQAVRVTPSGGTARAQPEGAGAAGDGGPSPESVRAAESLKERYDTARAEALRAQIERYLAVGRGALEREDYASAANAYRIAASLAPDDQEIQRMCGEVQRRAAASLADGYLKQAQYEENNERWEDAALSYAKVCAGRPDEARPHERAAFAMLKAGGSTRRAVEFARRAVELAPEAPEMRLTLARAYAVAGLEKSASGEISRAAELAKSDAKMRELVAQTRDQIRQGKPV